MSDKPASEIELAHLRSLWSKPAVAVTQPDRFNLCPNCLVLRRADCGEAQHASWCAVAREVARQEQEASEFMVMI